MLVHVRLVLDDAALVRRLVPRLVEVHCQVEVDAVADAPALLARSFDLAVLEPLALANGLLATLRQLPDRPALVVLEPDPTARAAALALGADAVLDPSGDPDAMLAALLALVQRRREQRLERHRANLRDGRPEVALVAIDPAMRAVVDTARRVAFASSPVLISGETGVGKERIAALIHAEGPRSTEPFVTVNCAALPTELFESELFGHAKGAFTGAHRAQRGLFERAHGGVLLLDEIGEMPLHLQAKLLRVIEEQQIRPVGSDEAVRVDVRIVAATNRDLSAEVVAGRFRGDLYYRLCVVELRVPPLRDRAEDIPSLAEAYLRVQRELLGRNVQSMGEAARVAMGRYAWPGNVRELANVIERAVLLCTGRTIGIADLPESIARHAPAYAAIEAVSDPPIEIPTEVHSLAAAGEMELPEAWLERNWKEVRAALLLEGEREYFATLLRQERGRVGAVAKRAGISSRALFDKMRRHGLRKEDFREHADA